MATAKRELERTSNHDRRADAAAWAPGVLSPRSPFLPPSSEIHMTAVLSASLLPPTPPAPPLLPLWSTLRTLYLARRPTLIGPDGEAYPETNVGDVRTILARLSAAANHPRFDHAQLADVRRAWRATLERAHDGARGRGWYHVHPDSLPLWWRDTRALALALGAVDARRAAMRAVDGLPVPSIAYADPRVLWGDLRHWFLLRRAVRRDRASLLTYPVTTVGEVAHVADLLTQHDPDAARGAALRANVATDAAGLPSDATYPDACGFWCRDSRRAVGALPDHPEACRD